LVLKIKESWIPERLKFEQAGRTNSIPIPQVNPLRRLTADVYVEIKGGTTPPTGRKNNHFRNFIQGLRLMMNADDVKFHWTAKMKAAIDQFEFGTAIVEEGIAEPTSTVNAKYHVQFIFDFSSDRKALSVTDALLDGPALSSLRFYCDWGTVGDIWTTPGTASVVAEGTYVEFSMHECYDNGLEAGPGEIMLADALANRIDFREQVATPVEIDQAHKSFGTDEQRIKQLPVPALFTVQYFLTETNKTDGNPAPSDDVVDFVNVSNVLSSGEPILLNKWDKLKDSNKLDYGLETRPTGVICVPWTDQRQGGLQNYEDDAIKIRLLTQAPASGKKNQIQIFTRYIPRAVR